MNPIKNRFTKDKYSKKEWEEIQQPLDYGKTGQVNPLFDKLYPDSPNPYHGTERDPNKERREYKKLEKEKERYERQMTDREKNQYKRHMEDLKKKGNF